MFRRDPRRAHDRRAWLRALAPSILLAASCDGGSAKAVEPAAPPRSERKPNIVLIVMDTARADHFSCYGYDRRTTPNADALATRGILFRNARSVAPWTLPSHMSMFTGLPPRDHGATWAAFSEPGKTSRKLVEFGFAPAEPERMLGARLRAAGYRAYGFSPNPWVSRNHGFAEGFEGFTELWRKSEEDSPPSPKRATTPEEQLRNEFQRTRSGAAIAAVERMLAEHPRGEPFFLFVNFMDSHFPYDPPHSLRERYGGKTETVNAIRENTGCEFRMIAGLPLFTPEELVPLYDADLFTADHAVGELLRQLASAGVLDDALVVLTSDHGEMLGENGHYSHQLYVDEPLMHVPLILKLPGGERAGTVVDDPLVSNLDVYATVLAAAGVEGASGAFSRDLIAASRQPPRELLIGEYEPSHAYLDYLHGLNDRFDVEDHLRDRFVVYTPEFRTELVGERAVATTPLSGTAGTGEARLATAAREAEKALGTYLAGRDLAHSGRARFTGEDLESVTELQALGYAGTDEHEEPASVPPAKQR